jgi:hypothetical protein
MIWLLRDLQIMLWVVDGREQLAFRDDWREEVAVTCGG